MFMSVLTITKKSITSEMFETKGKKGFSDQSC